MATIKCYHYYTGPLTSEEKNRFSPTLQQALLEKQVTVKGKYGGVCDWRVPIQFPEIGVVDISCVGPDSPDPDSATVNP